MIIPETKGRIVKEKLSYLVTDCPLVTKSFILKGGIYIEYSFLSDFFGDVNI